MAEVRIALEPVIAAHYDLLRHWLAQPHWRQWRGDPDEEFSHIRGMVEGRDSTRPYIFTVDGRATGYIQCWFIGPHQTEEWARNHPWLMELPPDAVGVDLSIGPIEFLSRGIGAAVLKSFVARLRGEGNKIIIIDPDPLNHRAARTYTKAGFRPIPQLEGRFEGVLIMQHHTSGETLPP